MHSDSYGIHPLKAVLLLCGVVLQGKYEFFNASYQLPVNENTTDPPRHNALHGLMSGKKLTVAGSQITSSFASLQLSYHFDKPVPGYPFTFDVVINYTLSDSGFSLHFNVTNRMESFPMPFYMGWHPYFVCTAYKTYVVLDKCTEWNHVELNTNMDPTGITKLYHGLNGSEPIGGTATNPTFFDDEFKPVSPTSPECNEIQTKIYDEVSSQTVVLWQVCIGINKITYECTVEPLIEDTIKDTLFKVPPSYYASTLLTSEERTSL